MKVISLFAVSAVAQLIQVNELVQSVSVHCARKKCVAALTSCNKEQKDCAKHLRCSFGSGGDLSKCWDISFTQLSDTEVQLFDCIKEKGCMQTDDPEQASSFIELEMNNRALDSVHEEAGELAGMSKEEQEERNDAEEDAIIEAVLKHAVGGNGEVYKKFLATASTTKSHKKKAVAAQLTKLAKSFVQRMAGMNVHKQYLEMGDELMIKSKELQKKIKDGDKDSQDSAEELAEVQTTLAELHAGIPAHQKALKGSESFFEDIARLQEMMNEPEESFAPKTAPSSFAEVRPQALMESDLMSSEQQMEMARERAVERKLEGNFESSFDEAFAQQQKKDATKYAAVDAEGKVQLREAK